MITFIWNLIRSIFLLFGATYLIFQISTSASVVSMRPTVYLVFGKSVDKKELQQRILERTKLFNEGKLKEAQLFQLGYESLYLQIVDASLWNRLKHQTIPDDLKEKIRKSPKLIKKVDMPTPLEYLSAISTPELFEDLDFVKATAHYYEGDTDMAIAGYRKMIDSANPLALINLASLLISQRSKLSFVINQLEERLAQQHDNALITNLLTLRLGEAYVAKRKFGRGASYLRDVTSSSNAEIANLARLRLSALRMKGLDVTYLGWLGRVFKLDLGKSVASGKEVGPQLKSRFLLTLWLTFITTLLAFTIAFPLGIFQGKFPDLKLTHVSKSLIYFLSGIPVFLVGYLCLKWFHPREGGVLYYLIAGLCLAFGIGLINQMVQRIQQETQSLLACDFFLAVKARKANRLWHLLVNLIFPSVSTFVSQVPLLLSGAIVVEAIFAYQGAGYWLFSAVKNKDFSVVLPACAILVFLVFIANILRNFLQYLIDPRLRS